jgi:uncharacterized membrane protein YheB (UPF0754 family)
MNYWLIFIPLSSAFIGWAIARLMFWSVFHPYQPKKIAGITFHGFIHRHKASTIQEMATIVDAEFQVFTPSLEQKLADSNSIQQIMPVIEAHVDDFLRNKLPTQMPMIAMFIGDKTIESLKVIFLKEIEDLFPKVIKQYSTNILGSLNVKKMVEDRIAATPPQKLEELLKQRLSGTRKKMTVAAVIVGLLVGILQLALLIFLL